MHACVLSFIDLEVEEHRTDERNDAVHLLHTTGSFYRGKLTQRYSHADADAAVGWPGTLAGHEWNTRVHSYCSARKGYWWGETLTRLLITLLRPPPPGRHACM